MKDDKNDIYNERDVGVKLYKNIRNRSAAFIVSGITAYAIDYFAQPLFQNLGTQNHYIGLLGTALLVVGLFDFQKYKSRLKELKKKNDSERDNLK